MINFKSLIDVLNDSINIANESLIEKHSEFIDTYFETSPEGKLVAKTITLNFPTKIGDHIKQVAVDAPLITLISVSPSKIDEVRFSANLEMVIDNNELMVSLSKNEKKCTLFGNRNKTATAHLEIILKPGETTEGLKHIIEGYEKILRAQIPG